MFRPIRFVLSWFGVFTVSALFSTVALAQVRPALVKNLDEPGRAPFQFYAGVARGETGCGGNYCTISLPAVPANKRLVITNVAVTIHMEAGATVQDLTLYIKPGADVLSQITLPYNPSNYPADPISTYNPRRYVVNERVLWFVEAGQAPKIDFHTSGGNLSTDWRNRFLVTGYYIDLTL